VGEKEKSAPGGGRLEGKNVLTLRRQAKMRQPLKGGKTTRTGERARGHTFLWGTMMLWNRWNRTCLEKRRRSFKGGLHTTEGKRGKRHYFLFSSHLKTFALGPGGKGLEEVTSRKKGGEKRPGPTEIKPKKETAKKRQVGLTIPSSSQNGCSLD